MGTPFNGDDVEYRDAKAWWGSQEVASVLASPQREKWIRTGVDILEWERLVRRNEAAGVLQLRIGSIEDNWKLDTLEKIYRSDK